MTAQSQYCGPFPTPRSILYFSLVLGLHLKSITTSLGWNTMQNMCEIWTPADSQEGKYPQSQNEIIREIKENIHGGGGETAYRDKTTETLRVRENVYSQTDFHANCDFQCARGRDELMSCKQEHWSVSTIVSRWRIDSFVLYFFLFVLRSLRGIMDM